MWNWNLVTIIRVSKQIELHTGLMKNADAAAETLGHIDFKYYVERYTNWLAIEGDKNGAKTCQDNLHNTLSKRNVLGSVLEEIKSTGKKYE